MEQWFDLVEGLSPWWWVAFGIGLGAVEMLTMSFFLIWPGLAAIVMAILVALLPGMPGELRIAIFAAIAIGLTFAGRSLMARFGDGGGEASTINDRSGQLVGRRATVLEWKNGEGAVEVDGIRWRANWDGDQVSEPGRAVEIVEAQGMTLVVRNHH